MKMINISLKIIFFSNSQ